MEYFIDQTRNRSKILMNLYVLLKYLFEFKNRFQDKLPRTAFHQFLSDRRRNSLGKDLYSLHHFYKLQLSTSQFVFHNFVQSIRLRRRIHKIQHDPRIFHYSSMDYICSHRCLLQCLQHLLCLIMSLVFEILRHLPSQRTPE